MKVEQELPLTQDKDTIVAIGVFDGVHIGHRSLIRHLTEIASKNSMLSSVVTFLNHPRTVINPEFEVKYITGPLERIQRLKEAGVDTVIPITFDKELSELRASEFVDLLQKRLNMKGMVMGQNFAMGHRREGNFEMLKKLGIEKGFSVTVIEPTLENGEEVSSTLIRKSIAEGNLRKASTLLTKPFSIRGKVVQGDSIGRHMGYPTANIDVQSNLLIPPDGIYATLVAVNNQEYFAASYLGTKPTFGGDKHVIEAFLIAFDGNLYGSDIDIKFIEKLRGDQFFNTKDELAEQIRIDVECTLNVLKMYTHGESI